MKDRIIRTGLYGDRAFDIIDSMHGQLADGMWKNSRGYEKYWLNFDVQRGDDGEVLFALNGDYNIAWCERYVLNPFRNMSDAEVKKWMAQKIKAVMCRELKDERLFRAWNRKNTDFNSCYLNDVLDITVADVYCTYDALLGRPCGVLKYRASTLCRIFGNKKSDAEIAFAKSQREAIEAINAKYDILLKKNSEELEAKIATLKDEAVAKSAELNAARQSALAKLKA